MSALDGVRLLIVTDRRLARDLPAQLAEMLDAAPGACAVQVREKDLAGRALLALVESVLAVARPRGAPVFVNDRLDVALAAGADGVHLPEAGLPVDVARALAPALLVGCSRHTVADAAAAARAGADLVVLGPIWATPGKSAPLGPAALTAARAALAGPTRLVAIGGIDSPARAAAALTAGAHAVAAIRALWTSPASAAALASPAPCPPPVP